MSLAYRQISPLREVLPEQPIRRSILSARDSEDRRSTPGCRCDPQHPNAYQNYAELGTFLLAEGKVNDALEHYRRALRIHDSDASLYTLYAAALWAAGQNRDAIRVCDAGLRLVEVGWARAWLLIVKAIAYHALGESDHAIAMIDDALTTAGPDYKFLVASSLAVVGRTDEARQLVDQMVAVDDPLIEAVVLTYAALGDERAFEWIHKGIDRHIATVVNSLRANPSYSSLRQDPRWNEVIANLEQEEAGGSHRTEQWFGPVLVNR